MQVAGSSAVAPPWTFPKPHTLAATVCGNGTTGHTDKKHEQTQAQLEGYRAESAQKDEAIVSLDNQVSRLTFDLKTAWAQVQKLSEDLTHATGALAVRGGQSRKFFNDSSLVRMSCCAT